MTVETNMLHNISFLEPEYATIQSYRKDRLKSIFVFIITIPFFPIVIPMLLYSPQIKCFLLFSQIYDPENAEFALVQNDSNKKWTQVELFKTTYHYKSSVGFEYRKQKYLLIKDRFERLDTRLINVPLSVLHQGIQGLSEQQVRFKLEQNGPNSVDIEPESMSSMIIHKVFHPFYLFQIASVTIWFNNGYPYYASVILILSILSASWEIYSAKKNDRNLRKLVCVKERVRVWRGDQERIVNASELVVGDMVFLDPGSEIVCDICLIQGTCVMDESTLTGETTPVVKSALPLTDPLNRPYKPEVYRSHTLFAGSTLCHIKPNPHSSSSSAPVSSDSSSSSTTVFTQAIGIVVATGFSSTKGTLFRSILFPHEIDLKINRQSVSFLCIMVMVAAAAFAFKLISGIINGESTYNIAFNSLDLITVAVPPALPLVLSMGVGFAMSRLKKSSIFCINPERINFAGWIDLVCWDKTGTLTTSSLQFHGFQTPDNRLLSIDSLPSNSMAALCLSCCHSLNVVNGEYVGHFVDTEMFRATGASLDNSAYCIAFGSNDESLAVPVCMSIHYDKQILNVLKRFDFDAQVQRSSVIIAKDDNIIGLVKGSPEIMKEICLSSSLPEFYDEMYHNLAHQGFYVIALGYKKMTSIVGPAPTKNDFRNISRTQVENGLVFCGFALFKSPIKIEAFDVMKQLDRAQIKSIMITGDGPLCAIHVAKQLGIGRNMMLVDISDDDKHLVFKEICDLPSENCWIPFKDSERHLKSRGISLVDVEFAMTANAFQLMLTTYNDDQIAEIMKRTTVYARAKPNDKTEIVERYITQGRYVAMTGDGTNDSGAMKAAHVGLALSDTEASIVAPFSSARKSIGDIPILLKEGRCALDTSLIAFKFMAMYPAIQMMTSIIIYYYQSQMGNPQYLVDDLVIAFGLATFMLYTAPAKTLAPRRPVNSLFSKTILGSLVGQVAINMAFTTVNLFFLLRQPWFCKATEAKKNLDSFYQPLDPSAPFEESYPCYYIDYGRDTTYGTLIASYEATFSWAFGHFQLIAVAIAFSISTVFRKPLWTNKLFVFWILLSFTLCSFLLLIGHGHPFFDAIRIWFQFRDDGQVPSTFRWTMLVLACLNIVACIFWEYIVLFLFPSPKLSRTHSTSSGLNRKQMKSNHKASQVVVKIDKQ